MNNKVGSIGAAWPPTYDRRNDRVKGFCNFKVDNTRLLHRLRDEIQSVRGAHPQATRTTVRAFVSRELNIGTSMNGLSIEARFDASNALPGFDLAYFGHNLDPRMPDFSILNAEMSSVHRLSRRDRRDVAEVFGRMLSRGYHVQSLNGAGNDSVPQLLQLYGEAYQEYTFEINRTTITEMLDNGNIVLTGRNSEGRIVSCLIAEHCIIEVNGENVHLYELSDYATLRDHRRNGLMTAMQIAVVSIIRQMENGPQSIIYAEDRAAWEAVNISSRHAGLEYAGTLRKHCVLVSDRSFPEVGRYENLNVWVAPQVMT